MRRLPGTVDAAVGPERGIVGGRREVGDAADVGVGRLRLDVFVAQIGEIVPLARHERERWVLVDRVDGDLEFAEALHVRVTGR